MSFETPEEVRERYRKLEQQMDAPTWFAWHFFGGCAVFIATIIVCVLISYIGTPVR